MKIKYLKFLQLIIFIITLLTIYLSSYFLWDWKITSIILLTLVIFIITLAIIEERQKGDNSYEKNLKKPIIFSISFFIGMTLYFYFVKNKPYLKLRTLKLTIVLYLIYFLILIFSNKKTD